MGLNYCRYCGFGLNLVDGTDPSEVDRDNPEWKERYECQNNHVGTYTYNNQTGKERFTGACKESTKAIA